MKVTLHIGTEIYRATVARPLTEDEAAALHRRALRLCSPLSFARWNRTRRERAVLNLLTQVQADASRRQP